MKKLFKKLGLSLAALACMFCAALGAVSLVSGGSVKANADITASDFYVSGAGVRLVNDANGTGLRFHTRITKTEYEKLTDGYESGTLIIPEIRYDGDLTLDDLNNDEQTRPLNISTTGIWYECPDDETDTFMRSTVYMYNVPEVGFGARYYARSYITVDGVTMYTELSPAISMSDISKTVTNSASYAELTKTQVKPYLVANTEITFELPDGSSVTETFDYGTNVTLPADIQVEYDKSLYVFEGWKDQYGNVWDLSDYEATIPVTLTPAFTPVQEKRQILQSIWRSDNYAISSSTSEVAPTDYGYNSIIELNLLTGKDGYFKGNTNMPTWCYNDTDISKYSYVYFAMKAVNHNGWYIVGNSSYTGEDWLFFYLQQADDGTWSVSINNADKSYTATQTGLVGTTLKALLSWSDTQPSGAYPTRDTTDETLVYFTEVYGYGDKDLTGKPPAPTETVVIDNNIIGWDYATTSELRAFQNGSTGTEVTENLPAGYSVAYSFDWNTGSTSLWNNAETSQPLSNGVFRTTDLSSYSSVYFAMKLETDGDAAIRTANWKFLSNQWIYLSLEQTADNVWTWTVFAEDGSTIYTIENYSRHSGDVDTLKSLIFPVTWKDLNGDGNNDQVGLFVLNGTTSTYIKLYSTEVLGIPKTTDSGSEEETIVPAAEETYAVSQAFVNAHGTTLVKNTDLGEVTVPNGFKTVSRFDSGSTFTKSSLAETLYDSTDLSAYSEVWVALKIDNGLLRVWNGWVALGTDGSWMYFHFTKTADSVWTIEITINGEVYTYEGQQGNTIKELTIVANQDTDGQRLVIYHDDTDTTDVMSIYSTELRTKRDEVWGERAIWSASDKWEPTEEWENPNKYTSIYKITNVQKDDFANVFAKLDLGTDYQEIRFGLIADKDLVFNAGYRCHYDLNADGVAEEVYTAIISKTANATLINQMNLVTLTKTASGWDVSITGTRWYQKNSEWSGLQTTEPFTCSVAGMNSISEIMTEIFSLAYNGTNLYVTEVRGETHEHVAQDYVELGDGTHQGYCWCGAAVGAAEACSGDDSTATCSQLAKCTLCGGGYGEYAAHTGGSATCSALAICEVCGTGYGEYATHVISVNDLTCRICNQAMVETTVMQQNGFNDASTTNHLTDNTDVSGVTVPAGFQNVTRKDLNAEKWTSSALSKDSFNGTGLYAYDEVWVAYQTTNAGFWRINNVERKDLTGVWVYYHFIRTGDTAWTIEISANGELVDTVERTGNTVSMIYEGGYTSGCVIYSTDYTDGAASVYATEIRGIYNTGISPNATQVWNHIWNSYYFEGGGAAEGVWSDEAAPEGFNKVSEYTFSAKDFGYKYAHFNNADITGYSDLYFAMKCVGDAAYIYVEGGGNYTGGDWLYVHFHQNSDGTWTKSFRSADGYFNNTAQTAAVGTKITEMMSWIGNANNYEGSHPNTTDGVEATAYFTDVLGVKKCDDTNHTAYSYTDNGDGTHTVTCSCGTVINATEACSGGTATCLEKAVCSLCGGEYGDVNASNHASTMVNCVSNGDNTHNVVYLCCGAVKETNVSCYGGTASCGTLAVCEGCGADYGETTPHSGGTATCKTLAVCATCGESYGELNTNKHESSEFVYSNNGYDSNGNFTHTKKYACCEAEVETVGCTGEWSTIGTEEIYTCTVCGEELGRVETAPTQQNIALYTNATLEGDDAFVANAAREVSVDLSFITEKLPISSVTSFKLGDVSYTGGTYSSADKAWSMSVVPNAVFGEYTVTFTAVICGKTFNFSVPVIVVTNMITTPEGMLNMRYILRGPDLTTPDEFLGIGGKGGDAYMNGNGYYMLGNDIAMTRNTGGSDKTSYVFGTSYVPFVGTFDGNGYSLKDYTMTNWFGATEVAVDSADGIASQFLIKSTSNGTTTYKQITATGRQDNYLNEQQIANGTNVNSGLYGTYLEGSLFGVANGTIKNVAFTNAQLGIFANFIHSGSALVEDVYVEITNLQANANVYVTPFFARGESGGAGTLRNVVFNFNNHSSTLLSGATNSTTSDTLSSRYPAATGKYFTAENVAVYGFDSSYISVKSGRGNIYNDATGFNDGSAAGIYAEYKADENGNVATNGGLFSFANLDDSVWKVVNGVPMLIRMASDTDPVPSTKIPTYNSVNDYSDSTNVTKDGTTEYYIAWDENVTAAREAAVLISNVMHESTGAQLFGGVADEDMTNNSWKKQIIVGLYTQHDYDWLPEDTEEADEYGIYVKGNTIYVLAESETALEYAAKLLCRELFGYNELAAGDTVVDGIANVAIPEDGYAYTTSITFAARGAANGLTGFAEYNDYTVMGLSDWHATPYTTYSSMHNTLDYFDSYTGDDKANMLADNSEDNSDGDADAGEQVCYLAHGNSTSFANMVNHVAGIMVDMAAADSSINVINFMVEDNKDYCGCSTCKEFSSPSIPQLIFLNELAAKLKTYEDTLGRVIGVEFFAYNNYSKAPILTDADVELLNSLTLGLTAQDTGTFSYGAYNKIGEGETATDLADYSAAKATDSLTVLKAQSNLRLMWTSHEANHSFYLTDKANDHMYLALLGWIASMGNTDNIDVFMYQAAYRDYFIPLNTWEYQVEWYQTLHKLGVDNYMTNLGDNHNNAASQTGFSAFKTYIDSRAMTDSNVTFDQLKQEFFGYTEDANKERTFNGKGYYGAGSENMLNFFEELVEVMEGHKQGEANEFFVLGEGDYLDINNFAYSVTSGYTGPQSVTSNDEWRQSFFNGAYGLDIIAFAFPSVSGTTFTGATDLYKHSNYTSQLKTLEAWYGYCTAALSAVNGDETYTKRINVESVFPEYAILLLHSSYTSKLTKMSSSTTWSGSVSASAPTTKTVTISTYSEFYTKVSSTLGFTKQSEFYTWNSTNVHSTGYSTGTLFKTYYGIYESMFKNWGVV